MKKHLLLLIALSLLVAHSAPSGPVSPDEISKNDISKTHILRGGPNVRKANPGLQPKVWGNASEVRSLATHGGYVWAATSGGLDRYGATSRAHFGTPEGLDTVDVRDVHVEGGVLVVHTAFSTCRLDEDRFACAVAKPSLPNAPSGLRFKGSELTSRAVLGANTIVGTSASGVWLLPDGDASRATRLDPQEKQGPRSFVKKTARFKGRLYIGTFDDGLLEAAGSIDEATDTGAPFRMVNDLEVVSGALFAAANEGLFFSFDGKRWQRVELGDTRAATGITEGSAGVYASTTGGLWKLGVSKSGVKVESSIWRPAGTKSIQGVAASGPYVYLATEDRGVVQFDGKKFRAVDRLSGLPTSWAVDVAGDGKGGAYMATLRDGVVHVNGDRTWSRLPGLPSQWTSTVAVDGGTVCVGTQEGAACYGDPALPPTRTFALLPDPRAHAVAKLDGRWLVSTEAGVALYPG